MKPKSIARILCVTFILLSTYKLHSQDIKIQPHESKVNVVMESERNTGGNEFDQNTANNISVIEQLMISEKTEY